MSESFTNDDTTLSTEIKSLERKMKLGCALPWIGGTVLILICAQFDGGFLFAAVMVLIFVLCPAGMGMWNSANRKIKKIVAESNILKSALEEVFDEVEYRPFEHLSAEEVKSAGFGISFDKMGGNDCIEAVYHGLHIKMSYIYMKAREVDRDLAPTFYGLWLICDSDIEPKSDVIIRERSAFASPHNETVGRRGGIKTGSKEFDKRFCVIAENKEAAMDILTPQRMETVTRLDEKLKARINLSFLRNGKMHLALYLFKDAFEIHFRDKKDIAGIKEKFVGELHEITDIIDALIPLRE